ncbi:MAG: class III extradiol ring-cleavage dioxygenase [Sphaerochaeta sp.]|jgi:4,5-DOPA dioxygenase extradiol
MSAQLVYLSHGGGPLPILGDRSHKAMVSFMKKLPSVFRRPKAIVIFSAHWEERRPHVIIEEDPGLYYDYYGFPPESYDLSYRPKTDMNLAQQVIQLLDAQKESGRGYDHGVFIPLMLSYPEADIPIVQVSQLASLSALDHWDLGAALRPLLDEEILFIGSGFSFHNIRAFGQNDGEIYDAFQEYLIDACTHLEGQKEKLVGWEEAPGARYCHPREEHLLSLQVMAGLAQREATVIFDDEIMGKRAVAFGWL